MPVVVLRSVLRDLAGGGEHTIEGTDVAAVLAALEDRAPRLRGFIRDERGDVRRHLSVFVNGEPADAQTLTTATDRVTVLPAVSGGDDAIELLLGTKKGLVVLRGERDGALALTGRAFGGLAVDYAIRDARSGRYYAACNDNHHGPRVWVADDPCGTWEPRSGPLFASGDDAAVERVWVITPGDAMGNCGRGSRRRRCSALATTARPGNSCGRCGMCRRARSGIPAPAG